MSKEHATKTTSKKLTTYSDEILDNGIALIRTGETQQEVARRLHVDSTKFGRAMRERYPTEYPRLIAQARRDRLNKRFGRAQPLTISPRPHGAGYVTFIDKKYQERVSQEEKKHQDVMGPVPRGFVRGMDEFTAAELAGLTAKLRQWVQSGAGRATGVASRQEAG